MTPVDVRPIRADEWQRLRDVRLAALADSPEAFITTLSEALDHPDQLWKDRAQRGAAGTDQLTVIATMGRRTVGLAIGLRRKKPPLDVVPIVSVFVHPDARRLGIADSMMQAIEDWARSTGATATSLWVVDGNDAARRFYESRGYEMTLDRQKITVPPVRWEQRMVRKLA